jgi:uncharacterized membrane protein YhaH (DUF805 family)
MKNLLSITAVAIAVAVTSITPALAAESGSPENALGLLALLAVAYFLPAIVASSRRHRNRFAIGILNLLVGWTLLGWIVAMVWACTSDVEPRSERKYPWSKSDRAAIIDNRR